MTSSITLSLLRQALDVFTTPPGVAIEVDNDAWVIHIHGIGKITPKGDKYVLTWIVGHKHEGSFRDIVKAVMRNHLEKEMDKLSGWY